MDISVNDVDFGIITGKSGAKFLGSNWASRAQLNFLKCAETGGTVLNIEILAEKN
jgi:hypothetical protein